MFVNLTHSCPSISRSGPRFHRTFFRQLSHRQTEGRSSVGTSFSANIIGDRKPMLKTQKRTNNRNNSLAAEKSLFGFTVEFVGFFLPSFLCRNAMMSKECYEEYFIVVGSILSSIWLSFGLLFQCCVVFLALTLFSAVLFFHSVL